MMGAVSLVRNRCTAFILLCQENASYGKYKNAGLLVILESAVLLERFNLDSSPSKSIE